MQWLKRKSGQACRESAAARIAAGDRGIATPATSVGKPGLDSAAWSRNAQGSAPRDSAAVQKPRRVRIFEFSSLKGCIAYWLHIVLPALSVVVFCVNA
jgi:hypothetical protein